MAGDGSFNKYFQSFDLWGTVLPGSVYVGPYPSQKRSTRTIGIFLEEPYRNFES